MQDASTIRLSLLNEIGKDYPLRKKEPRGYLENANLEDFAPYTDGKTIFAFEGSFDTHPGGEFGGKRLKPATKFTPGAAPRYGVVVSEGHELEDGLILVVVGMLRSGKRAVTYYAFLTDGDEICAIPSNDPDVLMYLYALKVFEAIE